MSETGSPRRRDGTTGPPTLITCPNCGRTNRVRPHAERTPRCANCKHPLPWSVSADERTFEEEVRSSVPVLVDLWAPWCGPCRAIAPVLERLAERHAGRLKVVRVDVNQNPGLAQRFEAMSIPTLLLMRDGTPVDRIVGAPPPGQLEERVTAYLQGTAT